MLGTLYLAGEGVKANPNEAEHWWRMAADQGYAASQYNLGGMFSRGLSTTLSREEAMDWLSRASEQGHRSAARELVALQAMAAAAEIPIEASAGAAEVEPMSATL